MGGGHFLLEHDYIGHDLDKDDDPSFVNAFEDANEDSFEDAFDIQPFQHK